MLDDVLLTLHREDALTVLTIIAKPIARLQKQLTKESMPCRRRS